MMSSFLKKNYPTRDDENISGWFSTEKTEKDVAQKGKFALG